MLFLSQVALPPWMGGTAQDATTTTTSSTDTLSSMDQQQQELVTALLQTLDPVNLTTAEDDSLALALSSLGATASGSNGAAPPRDTEDMQDLHSYLCPCCNFSTFDKDDLDVHACADHPDSVYTCKDCSFSTDRWGKYSRHINKHVIADKTFSCSYCSYRTKTKGSYDSHMRTHTGEKPYACSYCPYRSSQRVHLKIHVRTHTGEKPFACPNCPYQATQNSSLKRHIQTQHPPTPRVSRRYNKYTAVMPQQQSVAAAAAAAAAAQLMLPPSAAMLFAKPFQGFPLMQSNQAEQHLREMLQQQLQQFISPSSTSRDNTANDKLDKSDQLRKDVSITRLNNERAHSDINSTGHDKSSDVISVPDLKSLLQGSSKALQSEPDQFLSSAQNGKY